MPKIYEIAFKIAGAVSPQFGKSFGMASRAMQGLSDQARKLSDQAGQLGGIVQQRQRVGEAARAYRQAAQHAGQLGRAMSQVAQPTRAMQREMDKARQAAGRAKEALARQRDTLRGMEASAGTAGQSIAQLAARERELAKAAERAKTSQQKLARINAGMQGAKAGMSKHAAGAMAAGAAAGVGGALAVSTGMDFGAQMSRVGAVSRATDEQLKALTATARDLGAKTAWSATQAAEGMQYLAMAGFSVEDNMAAMPGMLALASASATDLGRTADVSSNILTGFGLKASEMGRVADVLTNTFTTSNSTLEMLGEAMKFAAPIAVEMGASIEETAAMTGKLHDAGIQATMAGTALRAMMTRLAKQPKQAADALRRLGVSTKDSAGNMRSMNDILIDIEKAERNLGSAERMRANAQIFGTEALSAASVLMKQAASGSLAEYTESLKRQGSAQEVADKQLDNLKGDVTVFKSVLESLQLTIYEKIEPAMRDIVRWATDLTSKIEAFAAAHPGWVKALAVIGGALAGVAAAAIPLAMAIHTVGFAVNAAKLAFGALNMVMHASPIGLVVAGIAALVAGFIWAWNNIEPFRQFFINLWESVKTAWSNFLVAAQPVFDGIVTAVKTAIDAIKPVIDGVTTTFQGLINFITGVFTGSWTQAWEGVKQVFAGIFNSLVAVVKMPFNGIIAMINSVIDGINSIGSIKIPDWVPGIGGEGWSVNIQHIPQLAQGGIATAPTVAMIGEGSESEAVLPLSRLASMLPSQGGAASSINVSFSPSIQISGQGGDAYAQTSRALNEGVQNLKRELQRLMQDERRLAYF